MMRAAEDEHGKPGKNAREEPGEEEPDADPTEEDEEPFDTYKLKFIQLCLDIGYCEPSHVKEMEGGSYNKIVGLTFPMFNNSLDNEKSKYCILRIPQRPSTTCIPTKSATKSLYCNFFHRTSLSVFHRSIPTT